MPIYSSTITDIVTNKMPQPYYRFDGVNNHIRFTAQTFDVTNHSASFYFEAKVDSTSVADIVLGRWGYYYQSHIRINNNGSISFDTDTNGEEAIGSLIRDDTDWHSYCVVCENSKAIIYQDGVLLTLSTDDTFTDSVMFDQIGYGTGNGWLGGSVSTVKLFNCALSGDEVRDLTAGGSVPFKYKGANQTALYEDDMADDDTGNYNKNGTLSFDTDHYEFVSAGNKYFSINAAQAVAVVAGKRYRVSVDAKDGTASGIGFKLQYWDGVTQEFSSEFHTTSTFTTVSYEFTVSTTDADVSTGVDAVDTTSGNNIEFKNLVLVQIGAVVEYDGSGIASDKWFDKSGNDLHGTVNGATVENASSGDGGLVYEEGRIENPFTINSKTVYSEADTNGGIPANDLSCVYRRIGDVVHCWYLVDTGGQNMSEWKDSGGNEVGTGDIYLNLPFASAGYNYVQNAQQMYYHGTSTTVYTYMAPATSGVQLYTNVDQSTALATADNESRIIFRCYFCYNLTGIGLAS